MNEEELRNTLTRVADRAQPSYDTLDRIKSDRNRLERRRRATTYGSALAGVVALAVFAVQVLPGGGKDPGGFATGEPNPPTARYDVDLVASNDGRTVTLWDPTGDASYSFDIKSMAPGEKITNDVWMRYVRFDENGTLRYIVTDGVTTTVWEKTDPISETDPVKILTTDGSILAIDYRANGEIAYMLDDFQQISAFTVTRDSTPKEVWAFPVALGRGIGYSDDLRISWSPDGNYLLLNNTYVDTADERANEMVVVLDSAGGKVASPFDGTHARWIDNTRIAYVPYSVDLGDRWRILDLTTGEKTKLALELDKAAQAAVSPDGKYLAVSNDDSDLVVVLDIAMNEPITITKGGTAPVWFDDHTLMTNEMEPCPEVCPEADYDNTAYRETGRVQMIDMANLGASREIASINSTEDASVLWKVSSDSGTEG